MPKCQPGPLLLIIDALDECSEDDVEKVAGFLQDLRNNAVDAGLALKICLSSRHYPFIRFKAHQELVLETEKQHDEDIATYISSNLTKRDKEIEEAIRKKSSGIFLWIVLVIAMLNRAYQDGKVEGMKDRLNEIPSALGEVFSMMLDKNNPDKNETILILQCVLLAKRLLTPEEIYFAVIAGTKRQALVKWDRLQITPDIIRRRIISSSRGLVEVRKGKNESTRSIHRSDNDESLKGSLQRRDLTEEDETVQFIHGSVNDFLVRNRRLQELDPELMPNPIAKSNDRLKDCCLSYLMMGPLELQNGKELVSNFPFLEYASSYLFDHAEEGTSVGQTELLRTLEDNEVFERVEYFHSSFVNYHHNGALLSLLQILAARELSKLVAILLDRGADINALGQPVGYALETAIAFESEETVRTLLSRGAKINIRGRYYSDDTALMRAFLIGNRRIVAALIEKGARPSIWERVVIGSMLSQAVSCGDKDMVAKMLDNGAKVNAGGLMVGTSLAVAALKGQKDIAEMLLERGAKINAVRGLFGTALGAAAVRGHMEVAKMLLEKGANIDKRGPVGSPLQVAAGAGRKEMVEMLLDKGANVNVQGPFLGNALHVAAKRGDKEIVEVLLKKGANINSRAFFRIGVWHEDAMDSDEARIQQMLLKKGIKVRRTWGKYQYGTALKAAAVNGRGGMVRLLLNRGAKC